jgi:hypothetical protein
MKKSDDVESALEPPALASTPGKRFSNILWSPKPQSVLESCCVTTEHGLEQGEILKKDTQKNKVKHVRTWTEKLTLNFQKGQSQCGAEIGGLLLVLSGVVAAVLIVLLQEGSAAENKSVHTLLTSCLQANRASKPPQAECLFIIGGTTSTVFSGQEARFMSHNGSEWLTEKPISRGECKYFDEKTGSVTFFEKVIAGGKCSGKVLLWRFLPNP